MTPEKKDYAKTVAIVCLSGCLGGALLGQFMSKERTMGATMLGMVIGGALTGIGYGLVAKSSEWSSESAGALRNISRVLHHVKAQKQIAGGFSCVTCGGDP